MVELMVCILITAIIAVMIGPSTVRLLRIHESLREEGFMREKLLLLASKYADWLSLAESLTETRENGVRVIHAYYPDETDGISLETNCVYKVTACHSSVSNERWNVWFETGDPRFSGGKREVSFDGDALLEHVKGCIVDVSLARVQSTAYYNLSILATNQFWDVKKDAYSIRTVSTERVVCLWNTIR